MHSSIFLALAEDKMEDCILEELQKDFERDKDRYIDSKSKLAGYLLLEKSHSSAHIYGQ